jgi:hypothetical protein
MKYSGLLVSVISAVVLSACGGGSSSGTTTAVPNGGTPNGGTPGAETPAPAPISGPVPAQPTGVLKSEQATASNLVSAVNKGVSVIAKADGIENAPGGVSITKLPSGIVTTIDCAQIPSSGCTGSFSVDTNITDEAFTAGSTITITYNNLRYTALAGIGDFIYNGTISTTYTRFVSFSDFASTTTYTGLTFGDGAAPLTSTSTCDIKGSVYNCSYLVDGASVSNASVTRSGTTTRVSSGTIRANFADAGGFVDCVYNNWSFDSATSTTSAGGVVTITGTNGTTAVITSLGAGKYRVEITVSGNKSTFNVG